MKKTIVVLSVILLLAEGHTSAQNTKFAEGRVMYDISYPDATDMDPQQVAMLPTDMTILIKDEKSRMEMKMGMGMSTTVIADAKTKNGVMLMDMMGNKTAIKISEADAEKMAVKIKMPEIKVLNETKDILGYKCKKAEVTDEKGNKTYIYFTPEIKARNGTRAFKGIDGFLLEYEVNQNGLVMKMTAKSINPEKVDDNNFIVPEGYKETTMEDLKKSMGGGGQ